jgi:hypothetical protein
MLDLPALPLIHEGRALEWPQARPDAYRPQIGDHCLPETREDAVTGVVAGIEAVGIPGFCEKLFRLRRIVGMAGVGQANS